MDETVDETHKIDLGPVGAWRHADTEPELAAELERLGYGTLWLGNVTDPDLAAVERLLDATETLVLATGIVNIWSNPADRVARSYRRIADRHPDRFLLGIGAGHPEATKEFVRPYQALNDYLDVLDAGGVPVARRALAALGPRVLRLAGDRTAAAHPYLVTPDHTRQAREILGPVAEWRQRGTRGQADADGRHACEIAPLDDGVGEVRGTDHDSCDRTGEGFCAGPVRQSRRVARRELAGVRDVPEGGGPAPRPAHLRPGDAGDHDNLRPA